MFEVQQENASLQITKNQIDRFAAVLLTRINKRDDELAQPSLPDTQDTRSNEVIATDVQKTNSLITPVVGIIRVKHHTMSVSKRNGFLATFTDVMTFTVIPSGHGQWKCLRIEDRVEGDRVDALQRQIGESTTGRVTDLTTQLKFLVEQGEE